MTAIERIKWIIGPALLLVALGVLAVQFPHAMNGFDDPYTGRGIGGLILLIIELLIGLAWGKTGGTLAILLGAGAIAICLFMKNEPPTAM